jgi:hypothetical protein
MSPAVETIGLFAGAGASVGGGFYFIKWLFEYFGRRMDRRADRIDVGTDRLIARLETTVEALLTRVDRLEADLADCKAKHSESDAKVLKLEALLEAKGEIAQRVQTHLSADRMEGEL